MTEPALRVLVVDDDPAIRRLLRTSLSAHGHVVYEEETGRGALEAVTMRKPDVAILDLGLPDMDGLEVTRTLREWTRLPVIVLSVRDRESDTIAALDAGADDYLTKPFGIGELIARLRVAVRHGTPQVRQGSEVFALGDLAVDFTHRVVTVRGQETPLTPTEYALLRMLVTHAGKVLTHSQMLLEVWGPDYERQRHLLRVNISNLRNKLEREPARPQYILTEPGVGYRLRSPE
jgi:two-component system KDP operon response regulator KdpE